jgi:hypothetical protein
MISNPNLNGNEIQTTAAQFEVFYSNKTTQKPPTSKSPNYELTSETKTQTLQEPT